MKCTPEELAEAEKFMTPWRKFLLIALSPVWFYVGCIYAIADMIRSTGVMTLTEGDRKTNRDRKKST